MTHEEIKIIRQEIRSAPGFAQDKDFLLEIIKQYRSLPREKTYELSDIFTNNADNKNWSRRKLNTLIEDLLFETRKLGGFSDDIDDLLSNYLDGLEGYCAQAARLKGDPIDNSELNSYARSYQWWQQDFYATDNK